MEWKVEPIKVADLGVSQSGWCFIHACCSEACLFYCNSNCSRQGAEHCGKGNMC